MTEKHAGGRPRKFQSVQEMSDAIDAYFLKCDLRMVDVVTKQGDIVKVSKPAPYAMSGLAYELGITRHTLIHYKDKCDEFGNEFLSTILRARARVEHNLEFRMYDGVGSPRGHEFGLKNNFDWTDKHEVDQKTSMTFHWDAARKVRLKDEEDEEL